MTIRLVAIVLLGFTSMLTIASCSGDSDPSNPSTGGLSLALTIADGIEIAEVAWEITGGDMPPMSGTINTSAPGSTASVEVFGIPEGDFVVTLEATSTDGKATCGGSAPFSVEAGEVTETHVLLRCKPPPRFGGVRVNGELNICAELTKVVVSPLQTSVGNVINLMADAEDAEDDPIEYAWTALVGTIADPADPLTTYTCTAEGDDAITITVSDDGGEYCKSQWTVAVTCVGDGGGTGGTGGTGGNGGTGGVAEGECTDGANLAVYAELDFVNGKGQASSGTAAASAIASECVRGSASSVPPVGGCGAEVGAVIQCAAFGCPQSILDALATCVEECEQVTIEEITGSTLSQSCVDCYGANVACGAAFCIGQCVADTTAQICIKCRCDNGCTPNFVMCSGIPSTDC